MLCLQIYLFFLSFCVVFATLVNEFYSLVLWRYLAIASISASGKDGCDRNSREMTAATIVRLTTEMAVRDTAGTQDGGD